MVLMDQPIKAVLQRIDASGRIAKWAIELTEFDINYRLRPSIKAQILANFVVECTIFDVAELEQNETDALLSQPNLPEETVDLSEGF
ncbi:putative Integrase, catalytic core [Cocos nucifera]|nr:putative Integrase, catalytic core [Cocos nucifera]